MCVLCAVKAFGLGYRARKTVEDETSSLRIILQRAANHANNYLVGHEQAFVHQLLGAQAKVGALGNLGAQQVAGAQVHEVVVSNELLALGSFAGAGRAEQHDIQHCRRRVARGR